MIKRSWHFAIRSLLIAGLLSITYISFFAISDVHAASSREGESAHPNLQSASGHATIIVLDMSGSMGQNDSHGYRCSAADAYIDLSGVNDYIGLIGLDNNNGLRIGNHDFESAQTWTTEPLSTATVQDQKNLKSIIASKSRNCRPDNTTPTYDALSKAYDMLNTITKQQDISGGSVILLTDGVPCPDVDAQINAIKSDLLPEFQAHNWPIDTIGLGQDAPISSGSGCTSPGTLSGTFHDFLKGISNATGGQFYDDGNGPVQGVSPLNIAGFFVDIFAKYSGETPKLAISPTPLNGGTFQRNFDVVGGSTKLDVVAVKDNAGIGVTLLNPDSQPVSSGTSGVTSSQDNYHVIYSITQPQAGKWIVNASGTGEFLLYSLQRTKIGLANIGVQLQDSSLAAPQALPLGQTLIVTAQLTLNDQPLSDRQYSLNGSINPVGSGAECSNVSNSFTLSGNASTYTGQVSVPANSAVGTYDVLICASTGTLQNVVASKSFPVRLEIFPIPKFVSPQTNQLTDTQISTTVVQWPLPLQLLYSIPLIDRLSSWPLQGHPAQPYANLSGQVEWNGQLYRGANIKATMSKVNSGVCPTSLGAAQGDTQVPITQDGQGNFVAQFQPSTTGLYQIRFETSGTFQDSQGSFGPTFRCVNATVTPETFAQLTDALEITLLYFVFLAILLCIGHFWFITPRPFGQWVRNQGGQFESNRSFSRAHRRNPLRWIFKRNRIYSREAGMPRGLEFRFHRYGKRIDVRASGKGSADWQMTDGRRVPPRYLHTSELVYRPLGVSDDDAEAQSRFTITTDTNRRRADKVDYSGYGYSDYSSFSSTPKKKATSKPAIPLFNGDSSSRKKNKSRSRKRKDAAPWEKYYDQ